MKFLSDYTNEEKVERFDAIYKLCLDHINAERAQEEPDPELFIDNMAEQALDIKAEDWNNTIDQSLMFAEILLN